MNEQDTLDAWWHQLETEQERQEYENFLKTCDEQEHQPERKQA